MVKAKKFRPFILVRNTTKRCRPKKVFILESSSADNIEPSNNTIGQENFQNFPLVPDEEPTHRDSTTSRYYTERQREVEARHNDLTRNCKKKLAGKKYANPEKLRQRKMSGYQLFISEYIKKELKTGKPYLACVRNGNQAWKELKATGGSEQYNVNAQSISNPAFDSMTNVQKNQAVSKKIKAIENAMEVLKEYGCQCLAVIVPSCSKAAYAFGTEAGECFMENEGVVKKFTNFVEGESAKEMDKKELRKQVQKLFNQNFQQASGKNIRVPYKIVAAKWKVSGMPAGIPFKSPSYYSVPQLRKILKECDSINFEAVEPTEAHPTSDGTDMSVSSAVSLNQNELEEGLNITQEPKSSNELEEGTDMMNLCSAVGLDLTQESESQDELEEGFYKLEKIIKKQKRRGVYRYLIKWAGFAKPTWEPEENVPLHLRDV